MSDNTTVYEVEKIVCRKLVDCGNEQKIFYRLKWKNFGPSKNTWEPIEHLDGCEDVLKDFELNIAHKIIGVKQNNGVIEYLMEQKDILSANKLVWIYFVHSFLIQNSR